MATLTSTDPTVVANVPKPVEHSKTIWFNILAFILGTVVPGVSGWVKAHPEEVLATITVANMILRVFTTRAVLWFKF